MWEHFEGSPYQAILRNIRHNSSRAGSPPAWGDADRLPWPRHCSIFTDFDIPADESGILLPAAPAWETWTGIGRLMYAYILAFGFLQAAAGWSSIGEARALESMGRVLTHLEELVANDTDMTPSSPPVLDEGDPVSDGKAPVPDQDFDAMDIDVGPLTQIALGSPRKSSIQPSKAGAPTGNPISGPSPRRKGVYFPNKRVEVTVEIPIPRWSSQTPSPRKALPTIVEEATTRKPRTSFLDMSELTPAVAASRSNKRPRDATPARSDGSSSGSDEEGEEEEPEPEPVAEPPKKKAKLVAAKKMKGAPAVTRRSGPSRTKSTTPAPATKIASAKGKGKGKESEPAVKKASKADLLKAAKVDAAYVGGIVEISNVGDSTLKPACRWY